MSQVFQAPQRRDERKGGNYVTLLAVLMFFIFTASVLNGGSPVFGPVKVTEISLETGGGIQVQARLDSSMGFETLRMRSSSETDWTEVPPEALATVPSPDLQTMNAGGLRHRGQESISVHVKSSMEAEEGLSTSYIFYFKDRIYQSTSKRVFDGRKRDAPEWYHEILHLNGIVQLLVLPSISWLREGSDLQDRLKEAKVTGTPFEVDQMRRRNLATEHTRLVQIGLFLKTGPLPAEVEAELAKYGLLGASPKVEKRRGYFYRLLEIREEVRRGEDPKALDEWDRLWRLALESTRAANRDWISKRPVPRLK